jgi:hypothetical protein
VLTHLMHEVHGQLACILQHQQLVDVRSICLPPVTVHLPGMQS